MGCAEPELRCTVWGDWDLHWSEQQKHPLDWFDNELASISIEGCTISGSHWYLMYIINAFAAFAFPDHRRQEQPHIGNHNVTRAVSSPAERVCAVFDPRTTMAGLPQALNRLISLCCCQTYAVPSSSNAPSAVPLGVGAAVLQASIYDVPGGYRAVMFDRFSGVRAQVRFLLLLSVEYCSCRLPGIIGGYTFSRPMAAESNLVRRPHKAPSMFTSLLFSSILKKMAA